MRPLYKLLFKLFGWKVNGAIPVSLKQYVMIVAPHTSNWDFFVGLAARSILEIDTKYVAKKELFRFPFGWIFRSLGGFPVDRSKNNNFVDAVADLFNEHDRFSICITPEGTRSYAPKWKTGFYYIAQKANIPVVMVAFDYGRKEVKVEAPYYLTGDMDKDIEFMLAYYRNVKGKFPEKGIR
ncbi:MAG: 1-acyl-sn-glycerol-3-phosphate acyltransferase [Bacteroidetes bacterium ADurb.Bin397]|jgi:1-acyl-sn-glycerol-3-phosphate acyltransferase|nr:MAG: 1-acyl-sn-glycerol-3-phosphate acyltransferase [Bacteroidetes bacterium ADurb.Bin397]